MLADIPRQLRLNLYSLPVVAASTVIFCIGLFVYLQNRKSSVNASFFVICLCVNLWLYGISFMYSLTNPDTALFVYKTIVFAGVAFIAPGVYCFSVIWLKLYEKQKVFVKAALLGGAFFYIAGATTNVSIVGIYSYFWGYYPHYGLLNYIFLAFFFGYFFFAFFNFVQAYQKETDPSRKTQIKFIAIAFLISFTGSVDYIPKLFYIPIYPVGYISVFLWIMTVAYSIVKYKVMDIETVIHRTILWLVTSLAAVLPIALLFYILGDWLRQMPVGVFAFFISSLFFVFFFYSKKLQPYIDHFFKMRALNFDRALAQFNDDLVQLKGLAELSKYIKQTISELLYIDKVQIFLKNDRTQELGRVDTPAEEKNGKLSHDNAFIRWLEREDRLALADFVDLDPHFQEVLSEAKLFFRETGIKMAVPLVLNNELIGLINLGQKANLKPFRSAEISFLSEVRRAVTIAFSNSLRLIEMQESLRRWNEELEEKVKQRTEELENIQKQLIQAEKLATMGTLAGGVAHEINNPLTAILTNVQMLKMDAKGDDLESFLLIEQGAKRCQTIVQKLMKYARKPAEQDLMKELDLNAVIQDTLTFLSYQLEQENIKLVKRFGSLHKIKGIPNELEQVFTNILLNAKDAVKAAKYSGVIEISTYERNGFMCAEIKDDGIGISKEHLSKVFDPFFTTKDVGKGTGLGLSITYGIVEKHGGKIEASSQQGKGSIFTISLPTP